jgi:DNA polymerase-3 subunit epsilon
VRQIILDTETTGLLTSEGHRVIEIAAVEMENRKLTGKYFHYYINPEREIDKGAENIHGISLEFLRDKPKFHQIAEEFLNYIKDADLIIHNAKFDTEFLEVELKLVHQKSIKLNRYCKIIDTLQIARNLHPGQKNSLDALCKRYRVDNSHRSLHGALLDANLLAHVYLAMTGGQKSLFGEESRNTQEKLGNEFLQIERQVIEGLLVIQANEEEIKQHDSRLMELQDGAK